MSFLLDTNCVSELVRIKPNARVTTWIAALNEAELYLSALTLGEIRKGISLLPREQKAERPGILAQH